MTLRTEPVVPRDLELYAWAMCSTSSCFWSAVSSLPSILCVLLMAERPLASMSEAATTTSPPMAAAGNSTVTGV